MQNDVRSKAKEYMHRRDARREQMLSQAHDCLQDMDEKLQAKIFDGRESNARKSHSSAVQEVQK